MHQTPLFTAVLSKVVLLSMGISLAALLTGCVATPETDSRYATEPPAGTTVCHYTEPTGSSIRQRVCYTVRNPDERNEEVGYVRDQLDDIRNQTPPRYPAQSQSP
jgi:hypothetical protein